MNQGDLGDLSNLDTATLLQHLPGVEFPAEKEEVAQAAESNGATQTLVPQIRTRTRNASGAPRRSCEGSKAPDTADPV